MEVYIVTNESFGYDLNYRDVIGVFDSLEKAINCIKDCADDFIELCDQGKEFDNYTIESTSNPYSLIITDDDCPNEYVIWYVDIYNVE